MSILVLGLGNDLLGDDGVGILAARELSRELAGRAEVVESGLHGIALMDILAGYDQAIIIDAVKTGRVDPGTIIELRPEDLRAVAVPSPHYSGLPEMIRLAGELSLDFPKEICILAVEADDVSTIGRPPGSAVTAAIGELRRRVLSLITGWQANELAVAVGSIN